MINPHLALLAALSPSFQNEPPGLDPMALHERVNRLAQHIIQSRAPIGQSQVIDGGYDWRTRSFPNLHSVNPPVALPFHGLLNGY